MTPLPEESEAVASPMMRIVSPFRGLEQFVAENVPLARFTWFRIGGPARWLITPRNLEELQEAALRCNENTIPFYVLGLGANILIGDDGIDGAVFRLSEDYWRQVSFEGNGVFARAGADMQKLLLRAVRHGRSGMECLAGIPGTVGGGIHMNAGGKFGNIGTIVRKVTVMSAFGQVFEREKDDLAFEYRKTNISAPFILDATFDLEEDDPDRVLERTKEIWMYKRNSQPLNAKSAGCVFKNPKDSPFSAGALIDQAGLKGMRIGGAEVSTKHANFIIANPGCKAADVLELMKAIQQRVYQMRGVMLESEVQVWPSEFSQ